MIQLWEIAVSYGLNFNKSLYFIQIIIGFLKIFELFNLFITLTP